MLLRAKVITPDNRCQYHRDDINKTNLYRPGTGIASDVIKEVKTVYRDLTKDAAWHYAKMRMKA